MKRRPGACHSGGELYDLAAMLQHLGVIAAVARLSIHVNQMGGAMRGVGV